MVFHAMLLPDVNGEPNLPFCAYFKSKSSIPTRKLRHLGEGISSLTAHSQKSILGPLESTCFRLTQQSNL